jgi:hypothetical protein
MGGEDSRGERGSRRLRHVVVVVDDDDDDDEDGKGTASRVSLL